MSLTSFTHRGALKAVCVMITWLVADLVVAIHPTVVQAGGDKVAGLIKSAGNADDDEVRLNYLKQLRRQPSLDAQLAEDLDKLIAQIDRWINEKSLPYFGRRVRRDIDCDFGIAADSPLYPLTYLYRGRMVTWYTLESGGVWNNRQRKRAFLDRARDFFQKYATAFPDNKIARMYLGQPIAPQKSYPAAQSAPPWAVYQREGLERLADIIEWWIDNRMQQDGQYGGGWGDDCEMWRWWVPVLIGFDDPKITAAQRRFSDALMSQPHMKLGYTTRMSDVEHTAEDSADVITPMMHLDPDSNLWSKRAVRMADLMESLWTGRNERGFLQFKSTYFTAEKVDTNPQRACDTVYHPRAVQPTLLYWQRTGDRRLTRLFSAWMDTWVDAAARAERGKPAGVIPSAIHWPDGKIGGLGSNWWDPRNHGEHTLYSWPSAMSLMTHTLLLTHHMTAKGQYLEPIRSMADIRLAYLAAPPKSTPAPGSKDWCASRLGGLSSVVAKYRLLTGNTEFDPLIAKDASAYMRFRLYGDTDVLVSALRNSAEALRINLAGYTSEVRYTDRVLRFPALFASDGILGRSVAAIRRPDPSLLYSTATGDPGSAGYFPLNAVRWLTPPRDIAVLVKDSGTDTFGAELFHFGKKGRSMSAELYLLKQGRYSLTVAAKNTGRRIPLYTRDFRVRGPRVRVQFELPARRLCTLHVRPR